VSDARIQAHLARGDTREAATAAIEEFGPAIWRYLNAMVKDGDDARDVFQLFAEDVLRGMPKFRGGSSVRTWLYRVAWCAAARYRRDAFRRKRQPLASRDVSRLAARLTSRMTPGGGRRGALDRLRAQLEPEDQTLIVLRIDQELSWDEVAEVLSAPGHPITPAALRKRFERLKEALARLAREEGLLD